MRFQGVFKIGKKENFRYNFFITKKRSIFMSVIVAAIIILMNTLLRFGMTGDLAKSLPTAVMLGIGAGVLLFALNPLFLYLRLRSLYKRGQLLDFTQDVTLDKQGVHASSERGSADVPWNNINLVRESRTDFILFITDDHAYVLPKDQMKEPEKDADLIRSIFRKFMDAKHIKLRG